jgi:hypothetical protein
MSTLRTNGSPFELLIFDCDGVLVDSEVIGRDDGAAPSTEQHD